MDSEVNAAVFCNRYGDLAPFQGIRFPCVIDAEKWDLNGFRALSSGKIKEAQNSPISILGRFTDFQEEAGIGTLKKTPFLSTYPTRSIAVGGHLR